MSLLSFSLYPFIASILTSVYLLSWIEAAKNGGITIDLIHRDSPLSPYYNHSKTHFEHLRNSFERSFSRISSLKSSKTIISSASKSQLEAPVTSDGGAYLMKIGIGTPPVEILAIADTGSDLTWTQCQPCRKCFQQITPLFDPNKTSTYRNISCQSKACLNLGMSSCDSKNTCTYQYSYGDSSYTIGDLSAETLTFGLNVSFPKVVFGCGRDNAGTFSGSGSGIIGLGGGRLSIINQLRRSIGGRFSYCLTLIGSNGTSKISFGSDAIVTGHDVVSTPLVKKEPSTYYHLTLEGVSVGAKRVATSDDYGSDEGNIIIDSGTTLTFLPSGLYEGVESAMIEAVKGKRVSDSQGKFKLCYEKARDFRAPPVTAHFKGADVELTQENTFLEVEDGVVCLTLGPNEGLAIFGNLHQMNYEIGYDVVGKKVSFLRKDCSNPQ